MMFAGLAFLAVLAQAGPTTPILDSMRAIDEQIRALEASITNVRNGLSKDESQMARLVDEEMAIEREIAKRRVSAREHVRGLHRLVPRENAATGLPPFEEAKFVASMRRIIGRERVAVARYHELVVALAERRRSLATLRIAQAGRHSELVAERDRLSRERDQRLGLVASFHRDRAFGRRARQELFLASESLDQTFPSAMGADPGAPTTSSASRRPMLAVGPFSAQRRRLRSPVDGPVEVPFGPHYDSDLESTVFHKGIDVRAPLGTPVVAIFDGTVAFTGVHSGYGDIVIVDHGAEYFSLSAHLSRIDVKIGDAVASGESIGAIGDSGSFKGPYLYFEIRHRGRPINPMLWFRRGVRR